MKKMIAWLLIAVFALSLSGCGEGDELYVRSPKAHAAGEISNVIDVYVADRSVEGNSVTLKVGIGGDFNPAAYEGCSMFLKITAPECRINGSDGFFEKEYADYYENAAFRADVDENFFGYPDKTPNYYESVEISFPSGECLGTLKLKLVDPDNDDLNTTAEIAVYYASNGTVLWLADETIMEIDDSGRPIYANELDDRHNGWNLLSDKEGRRE